MACCHAVWWPMIAKELQNCLKSATDNLVNNDRMKRMIGEVNRVIGEYKNRIDLIFIKDLHVGLSGLGLSPTLIFQDILQQ